MKVTRRQQKLVDTLDQLPEALQLLAHQTRIPVITFLLRLGLISTSDLRVYRDLARLDAWVGSHPTWLTNYALTDAGDRQLLAHFRPHTFAVLERKPLDVEALRAALNEDLGVPRLLANGSEDATQNPPPTVA